MLITLTSIVMTSGCWNYREVDKLSVVAGVAIDKGETEQYAMTAEIIQISHGKEAIMTSRAITAEGKTLFDAARNMISVSGARLYWSHAKVVILSQDIAGEGISKITDLFIRDAETREDVPILISKEKSAKEIFAGESTEAVISMALGKTLENQKSLGKAQMIDILEFSIESQLKGASIIIPTIGLKRDGEKKIPEIIGSAIIKNDRLAGFLDGEETKYVNLIRNEIKSGVLTQEIQTADEQTLISLEIFKNKTKVTPIVEDENIKFNIDIETKVAINEIVGKGNYFDEDALKKLGQNVENTLKTQIEAFIMKIQSEYDADIFGFAEKLWEDKPQTYKAVRENWDEVFKGLQVNVQTKIIFENSAVIEESKETGE